MSEAVVIVKRVIKADPGRVFEAFTKPEIMSRWFYGMENGTSEVSNTLEVGGGFRINMRSPDGAEYMHTGEYRDIQPNERLVFTWNSDYAQDTVVTVSFRPVPDGTEVTIEHELLTASEREPHRRGWTVCVNNLEKVFA
ncbi:MAG: SRPBCC domain-containing protein [Candidatus Dadabacteria bacterium]|nr:SRPBCC domain-containing protein [Candidatus Dadabacteria bacterium]